MIQKENAGHVGWMPYVRTLSIQLLHGRSSLVDCTSCRGFMDVVCLLRPSLERKCWVRHPKVLVWVNSKLACARLTKDQSRCVHVGGYFRRTNNNPVRVPYAERSFALRFYACMFLFGLVLPRGVSEIGR